MPAITPSKLKIEEANNAPSTAVIEALMEKYKVKADFVDLDPDQNPYWQNNYATMVLTLKVGDMASWGNVLHYLHADEYGTKIIRKQVIIRLWWD